jgi:hypothetical protein
MCQAFNSLNTGRFSLQEERQIDRLTVHLCRMLRLTSDCLALLNANTVPDSRRFISYSMPIHAYVSIINCTLLILEAENFK